MPFQVINRMNSTIIQDFLHLIFPNVCAACNRALYRHEECLCTFCRHTLPMTGFHLFPENPIARMFCGRVPLRAASACYRYRRGSRVQAMIHRLKYKGEKEIGVYLGKIYGTELLKNEIFSGADIIVPVPLHAARLHSRGFNQSAVFGEGLAESMNKPLVQDLLLRAEKTKTQTKKGRFDRWENAAGKFVLGKQSPITSPHILLIDDVITTGATLESCVQTLRQIPGCSVSIAAIAGTLN